jgi:hypothetical protein
VDFGNYFQMENLTDRVYGPLSRQSIGAGGPGPYPFGGI